MEIVAIFRNKYQQKTMKTTVGLVSLGCPKNLVDAEEMLGALTATGQVQIVDADAGADTIIVNTCAFIESAKQESIDAILHAVRRKERGEVRRVVVTGCLAQRYGDELAREIPEADAFLGIQSAPIIAKAVFATRGRALPMATGGATSTEISPESDSRTFITPLDDKYPLIPPTRLRATAPWTAYLKVSEGCDHGCTFCAIPNFRGKHRSKPLENIIEEAKRLADAGTSEINLIAQDTTAYGMDLYRELALPRLLEGLGKISGLHWVRLLYCYPTMMTDRLIKTMANVEKVAQYVDVPLQHGDDGVLQRMKRGGSVSSYMRLIERLRGAMPDIAIRTTFLVGFPGEDDAAFANLKTFVTEAKFDRLGVFTYSPEDHTPGATMTPRVSRRRASERRAELMALQQPISQERNQGLVGREIDVLVEGRRGGDVIGRSWRDAPDIDGSVIIHGAEAAPGAFLRTRIIEAQPYDLVGVRI